MMRILISGGKYLRRTWPFGDRVLAKFHTNLISDQLTIWSKSESKHNLGDFHWQFNTLAWRFLRVKFLWGGDFKFLYFSLIPDLLEHLDVPDPSKNSVDQPTQADMSDATTSTPTPASTDMSVFLLSNQAVRRDVTKTLQNQVPLLTAWERFCDDLDIPKGELITCKQQYSNGCMTNYALLNHILSLWGSREGSEGNVANLIKVLRSGEFLDSESKWLICILNCVLRILQYFIWFAVLILCKNFQTKSNANSRPGR